MRRRKASKSLKRNRQYLIEFLRAKETGTNRALQQMISNISCCQLKCLSEIVRNLLRGNIPMSRSDFEEIKKHKKNLRLFGQKKVSLKRKRAILQTGSGPVFLPLLLGAVLPPVLEFIAKSMA